MKLFSILTLAGLAAAEASIYERQVATIVNVISQISTDTQSLDTAVKGFNGAADIQMLQAASDKVSSSVTNGVTAVNAASSISLTDAVQLQGQVQTLGTNINTTVTDLIAKKNALVSAGAGPQVLASLNQQLTGAKQLSTAISSKVPPSIAGLAGQLSSGVTASLQMGVDAFQGVGAAAASTVASRMTAASTVASRTTSTATASRKPATFSGAATPRAVAGSLAGVAGLLALVF